jgi:hypothetical protein
MNPSLPPVLDPQQLARIESVHRGFLYQHLYAAACLLSAQNVGATSFVIERDEDVEIIVPRGPIYTQIKTRSRPLIYSDIADALERFDALRLAHTTQIREGTPSFIIIANAQPGPELLDRISAASWPSDVAVHWPGGAPPACLPAPDLDVASALSHCTALASSLPYGLLAPETLVWKLAGNVMAAASGTAPRRDHRFRAEELPGLFEQLVVQLQDFPAPPEYYRALEDEPELSSTARVRLITGYSGSGKTSWVSHAALHTNDAVSYFDVTDTPGPGLAAALARDLAAQLFGRAGGRLGELLLPGASGLEILRNIGARLEQDGRAATIVLDNAHRIPVQDMCALIQRADKLKFLLLSHPGRHVQELQTLLGIVAAPMRGWSVDTIALEISDRSCRADLIASQRLRNLTGGMPLYVQNAVTISRTAYGGDIARFCDAIEAQAHTVETAQELILRRVFEGLPEVARAGMAVLSLADIPLDAGDLKRVLHEVLALDDKRSAALLRELRSSGVTEIYGGEKLKIHDAMRLVGQSYLEARGQVAATQVALRDILEQSLRNDWDMQKLSLYLRMASATGDIKTLVQIATDELFHELGMETHVLALLEKAAETTEIDAEQRFWALDGLVFSDVKRGKYAAAAARQEQMSRLIEQHNLGTDEILALAMKRMNLLAVQRDSEGVLKAISQITDRLPDTPQHQRIFRYNAAHALFSLGRNKAALREVGQLIAEYLEVLGIGPSDVLGHNPDKIRPLLKERPDLIDNLKHLADCLDLQAHAASALGQVAPLARINAMKFYAMANALDSLVRVGQDLVDEFVERRDFIGARQVIESNLLPNVVELKMLGRIIPVRSQYAVVLAYCGEFDAAEAEMARLLPYEAGLDEKGRQELRNQRQLVGELRRRGPPPQWLPGERSPRRYPEQARRIGRNDPCPCGSGKKYKRCHGRDS